jgi:hypothetical protein
MQAFCSESDLDKYLQRLGSHYSRYAKPLWEFGVRSAAELANASSATLKKAGIDNDLHLENVKGTATAG